MKKKNDELQEVGWDRDTSESIERRVDETKTGRVHTPMDKHMKKKQRVGSPSFKLQSKFNIPWHIQRSMDQPIHPHRRERTEESGSQKEKKKN